MEKYSLLDSSLNNLYNKHYYEILKIAERKNKKEKTIELKQWKMDCVMFVTLLRKGLERIEKKKKFSEKEYLLWEIQANEYKSRFINITQSLSNP